jgi:uncharacterized protein with HEPN domain
MQTKDRVLLNKILDEIEVIETVQQTIGENAFFADKVRQHAVVMALLNSGELARNLDEKTRRLAPEIPWMQVIGLRNVAAHGYASLSMTDIWKTVVDDVPQLKASIKRLLAEGSGRQP